MSYSDDNEYQGFTYNDDNDFDEEGYGEEWNEFSDDFSDDFDQLQPERDAFERTAVGTRTQIAGTGMESKRLQKLLSNDDKTDSQSFLDIIMVELGNETQQKKDDYTNWIIRIPRFWTKNIETLIIVMKIIDDGIINLKKTLEETSARTKIDEYDLYRYYQLLIRYQ